MPKLSKRTTTVAKAVDIVVAWVVANVEMFSPKNGWAHTARGYEPNMESVWQEAFPAVNPVDDFESWAAARTSSVERPAGFSVGRQPRALTRFRTRPAARGECR